MNISVSQIEKINAVEGQKIEFKTSAFYAPTERNPSLKQMRTIAETVASFMNADGGALLIGVKDDGTVVGIDADLDVLGLQPSSVALHLPQMDDSTFTYGASHDKYQLKLRNMFKAFLGPNHMKCLGEIKFVKVPIRPSKVPSTKICCMIEVKKCDENDFVYCSEKYSANGPVIDEIFVRSGNQKRKLQGAERDVFVKDRVMAGFNAQKEAVRAAVAAVGKGTDYAAVMDSVGKLLSRLDELYRDGPKVTVSGGQPFTEEAVTAAKKPKALAWEGCHYAEVGGWQELVLKVLEKLQETDAAKFDVLADDATFKKHLVKIKKPKEKHPDCYPTKFGADGKIRVKKSLGGKTYLWREDMVLRKLIAAFGIDVSKFMFVAG